MFVYNTNYTMHVNNFFFKIFLVIIDKKQIYADKDKCSSINPVDNICLYCDHKL